MTDGGGCLGLNCFKTNFPDEREEELAHSRRSRAFSVMLTPDPGSGDAAVTVFDIDEDEDDLEGILNEDPDDSVMGHRNITRIKQPSNNHMKKKTRFQEPEKPRKSSSSNLLSSLLTFMPFRKRESSIHHWDESYDYPKQKRMLPGILEDDESIENHETVKLSEEEDEMLEDGASKRNRKALYDRGRQQFTKNRSELSKESVKEEESIQKEPVKSASLPKEFKTSTPEKDEKQDNKTDKNKPLCEVKLTTALDSSLHELIGGFLFVKSKGSSHQNSVRLIKLDPFITKALQVHSDEPLKMKKIDYTIDDHDTLGSYLVPCYLDPLTQEVQVLWDSIMFRSSIIVVQFFLFIFVILWFSIPEAFPFIPAT